jgi:hypothetical protein
MTIEDPVEYEMQGINQIQVNPKTNLKTLICLVWAMLIMIYPMIPLLAKSNLVTQSL